MVGQLLEVKVGALSSFVRSTFKVNWSDPPLDWIRLHGTATRLPLDEVLDPRPEVELVPPMPVELELLEPGAPDELPLRERMTNWAWPVAGSMTMSWT